jgi:hypothetical protein
LIVVTGARIELPSPRKLVSLILAAAALVVAIGATTALLVVRGAEEIAESRPYCIQIADGRSDYRPARSWLDLSALTMWARRHGPLYMQHHAILVAGEGANQRLYHWSYRRMGFEEGVLNGRHEGRRPALTCVPARDFAAAQLALIAGSSSDSNYVMLSAREAYLIPAIWQAKWNGGMSRTLVLAATAPDFHPLERRWSDLAPGERDNNCVFIDWNPEWMLSLMKSAPGGTIVEQGAEYRLSKTRTVTRGKDGKEYVGYRYMVYADESSAGSGINTTVIGCGMPSAAVPKSCQHRFINKGRQFYFRHRPEDVADWQRMQGRILELMDSFEVHGGRS